ncbi:anti-sigma factor [Blastococcus sp. TF02A-26]|uniref:anti-sigma factor n=1 Tax=Blastococcus sp. TF02A-26 TaxID=2250577 RepID=UPI000DEAEC33|nr:anti-sigma factor [Blastococcus sp. TF02A-26]RBY87526.1 ABC transporter substrate-binding protein [Blastococcus sp. TF02A-26]
MPQHCTPEDLALAALGEPLTGADAAHLDGCAACTAEVASLRRSVEALAVPEFSAHGPAVAPPAHVWTAIAAATGVTATPEGSARVVPEEPARTVEVVPLRPRRSRLLLAAAAAGVVGVGIGAGAVVLGDRDDEETTVAVAAAQLDPLGENRASGEAEVVERPDGSRVLRLDLDADAPEEGYLEVWLIDPDVVGMVSVGVVSAGTEELELPADLDVDAFPIVDVSVEPLDGDPSHSGVSVARGQLA